MELEATACFEISSEFLLTYIADQRFPTGGPHVTSDPRSLVTRPTVLFVNLLQCTANSLSLFRRI
jgi:hypothetical protein